MDCIKILLLIVTAFYISCQNTTQTGDIKSNINENISQLYQVSKNNSLSIESRFSAIDSAYQLLPNTQNDTLKLKVIDYKSIFLNVLNKLDEYQKTSTEFLALALKNNSHKHTGKAYFKLGNYFFKQNETDSAFYYFNKSKEIFINLNDSIAIFNGLLNMAIIQSNNSDYYGAEKTGIKALKYLNSTNKKQLLSIYNSLSITTNALKNYDEALFWTQKTEQLQTDKYLISITQNNKAVYYIEKKDYTTSYKILTNLLQNKELEKKEQLWANIKSNLGYTYLKQKKYKAALPLLNKALAIQQQNNMLYETIESYRRLSEFYEATGNIIKANIFANKAHKLALQTSNLTEKVQTLKRRLDFTEGAAYKKLSQQYIQWNDSLQLTSLKNRDLFAKIKYETEKNRNEILELNTKTVEKDLKITREKNTRYAWIFVASMLLLGIGFSIFYWRQRVTLTHFKATQETENRISKKVHDELANDISDIRTLVEHQIPSENPIKSKITTKLDTVYVLTRDIATETGSITFLNSFGETLNNLLLQHNHQGLKIITTIKTIDKVTLNTYTKSAIYRTLQELMVNMNKHSQATKITIALKSEGKKHTITYSDNGVGAQKIKRINGLQNAENRMQNVGGSFTFKTSKGNGFKAIITFKA